MKKTKDSNDKYDSEKEKEKESIKESKSKKKGKTEEPNKERDTSISKIAKKPKQKSDDEKTRQNARTWRTNYLKRK